jgi:hypothetical protein
MTLLEEHAPIDGRVEICEETAALDHGSSTPTLDLIRAWEAAQLLVRRSPLPMRTEWEDAVRRLETRLAVRCVIGDAIAVAFFARDASRDEVNP